MGGDGDGVAVVDGVGAELEAPSAVLDADGLDAPAVGGVDVDALDGQWCVAVGGGDADGLGDAGAQDGLAVVVEGQEARVGPLDGREGVLG